LEKKRRCFKTEAFSLKWNFISLKVIFRVGAVAQQYSTCLASTRHEFNPSTAKRKMIFIIKIYSPYKSPMTKIFDICIDLKCSKEENGKFLKNIFNA
jgi:hypothetical protein